MKFTSFNVNGVRAAMDKGLRDYLTSCDADVICLQEVKALQDQADLTFLKDYEVLWNPAVKKGYSGTAVLTRIPPKTHVLGVGMPEHDNEGRVITAEFPDFYLVNVYTPNAQEQLKRLPYRLKWDADFRTYLKRLEQTKPVFSCGDFNVAHEEIDIARPKENRKNPGFSDEERASFSELLNAGFIDTFRELEKGAHHYSWWSYRANARANNVGWRIDYWLMSQALRPKLKAARIRPDIYGSDHCPVELEIG
ncbi:exodeoxyribonuclease III [Roseimicrobium sp. ORNL1]|uniref:exodeoxyribonuclease III n=1 Tax=Roseimicrobium sp. ORNL1 TaxID=2711231 RepID=UPI0013E0EADD|nr:exodeoxyribonuclease III [Roseimicrobium sp. ORNL1]QIF05472.1 exodeoxyribonuclease III [Roseimicrobium sp. ORNL1]